METYRAEAMASAGIHDNFLQDNHSRSARGVLRGLHYQLRRPQAKLCRVVSGEIFDVAVDIRLGSPTFGKWYGVVLSGENKLQIYLPCGFAHGFVVRSDTADFLYKCSDYYDASDDRGILWNDPTLGIAWETPAPIVSPKDLQHPLLAEVPPELLPRYTP
jgi:dTDP-4-dehydrorhamnose 3,5-epimerase